MASDMVRVDPFELAKIASEELKELNEEINVAVRQILSWDERIRPDPENVMALKDYIMADVVQLKVFKRIMDGSDDSDNERLFKSCLTIKNVLRDEIWGDVKGQERKDEAVQKVREVLIEHKIIEAEVVDGNKGKPTEGSDKK